MRLFRWTVLPLFLITVACAETEENPESVDASSPVTGEEGGDRRQGTRDARAAESSEKSPCVQACGLSARGEKYTECIDAGGDKRDCGYDARVWYRECIESRCGEPVEEGEGSDTEKASE